MRTLVEYGLANAVAATALAVLAFAVGRIIRRPAIRNALWLLVFVRLLLPPVWSIEIPVPKATPKPDSPGITSGVSDPEPIASTAAVPVIAGTEEPGSDLLLDVQAPDQTALAATESAPAPVTAPTSELQEAMPRNSWTLAGSYYLIVGIWIAGSAFVAVRSIRRIRRFCRALEDAIPAPTSIQASAEALSAALGLRRCPEILLVPGRMWPALWMPGLFARRAKVILPAGLLPLLSREQQATVLAHELAHLRRGDPWVRWLELIICAIYWWHPLLGWFRRKLREAEEDCCDLWVIAATSGRKSYATALVEAAVFVNGPDRLAAPVLASGAGPVRNLQRRVTMIMSANRPARLTRLGLVAILGIGGLGLAFGPAMAQPPKREDPSRRDDGPKEPPRERRDGQPRERDRGSNREIDDARAAVEKARQAAHEAMMRLTEAEARLAKLEGRPMPNGRRMDGDPFRRGDRGPDERRPGNERAPGNRGPGDRGPGDRGPGDRGPGDRGPGDRGPGDRGPGDRSPERPRGTGAGPGPQLQELRMQIEELRRAMEEMRREMRRGSEDRRPDNRGGKPGEPSRRSPDVSPKPAR